MKPRVCFVVQRYGLEVNGGAELLCRQLAEHLCPYADVHVATSKAINYTTWADEYENDVEEINGVTVHRFSVAKQRDVEPFNIWAGELDKGVILTRSEEERWVDEQGPFVPALVEYLKEHKEDYDVFIFNTYLYYPTVRGIEVVGDKAIVIPDAHDEPFLRMHIFEKVFKQGRAYFYNTEEERRLAHKKFYSHLIKSDIGGAGVEVPDEVSPESFKSKYGLNNYVVYVGRIDIGKNCHTLFEDFAEYKNRYPSDLKLVLMGKEGIPVPQREDIVSLGFVDDADKFNGIAGAKVLILPSKFESLSIVVLEAFNLKVPVLVNGFSEVLKAHCVKSNGGFYYNNREEFIELLQYLLEHPEVAGQMGKNGLEYVKQNYQWDIIIKRLMNLIDYVIEKNSGEMKI